LKTEGKMEDKDLGDGIEKFEEEIENLKNTKMKLFGITMTPTTIGAAFAIISSIIGGLYGSFQVYDDYMGMKEIVENIDIQSIQSANELQLQKLDDAITYTRDIKDDLKQDIVNLEANINRIENKNDNMVEHVRNLKTDVYTKLDTFEERLRLTLKDNQDIMASIRENISNQLDTSENRIKDTQAGIDKTLDGIRNEMNTLQKDITASIREVEGNNRLTEKDLRESMRTLEKDIGEKLQEALDNPLSK
jgi:DNA anti-recombination protein RmuC